ncbi:hypothetical protein E1B28_006888 [Marasmius oreades]|uniref:F-box domain-containing protein n=1 Tax=Marasmius oreades TaxID=181124 RepID=A0A9P7UT76_9AGAR|nr:uncharacterized protein E1B28_006888 [Marasmius oreades]KAG7093198.1 hypothetical protein E1B28_006888 [Marasmius oreades]
MTAECKSLEKFLEFPDDVWQAIFHQVDRPIDLLSCILACKRFKNLALFPLYHAIHYKPAFSSIRSLSKTSFAQRNPSTLGQIIRTVVLTTSNGRYKPSGDQPLPPTFASSDPDTLASLFHSSFAANVTKVVFISARLPSKFYVVLASWTRLRALYLHSSWDDPASQHNDDDPLSASASQLPTTLVDVRVWNHNFRETILRSRGLEQPIYRVCGVVATVILPSQHLHTLYLDWKLPVAHGLVGRQTTAAHPESFVVRTAPRLRVLHVRLPSAKDVELNPRASSKMRRLYVQLGIFLRACSNLEELHLVTEDRYRVPSIFGKDLAYVGLSNIKVISVPSLHFLPFLVSNTAPLESLQVSPHRAKYSKGGISGKQFSRALLQVPSRATIMSTLSEFCGLTMRDITIFCKVWHHELLLFAVQHFPRLEVLKIGYEIALISEVNWQSMGDLHLRHLPALTTFYLYQRGDEEPSLTSTDPSPRSTPDDVQLSTTEVESALHVLTAWSRRVIALNEVSFDQDSVWTRGKVFQSIPWNEECPMPQPRWKWSEWRVSKRCNRPGDDLVEGNREVDRFLA